jgi:IS5 family transposase
MGLDARWVPKNGVNHYGYKNNICIDVEHGFIRHYAVTPANIYDSQMMPMFLDPENTDDYVCADSGPMQASALKLTESWGSESYIHEKGSPNRPLSDAATKSVNVFNQQSELVLNIFLAALPYLWMAR